MAFKHAPLFAYDHLPEHLQAVSKPFADLAETLVHANYGALQMNHPATFDQAMWKLWEAKNLAVVAAAQQDAP